MKRILIGALIASSLAMSGDLDKCSQAIDMKMKYLEAGVEHTNKEFDI